MLVQSQNNAADTDCLLSLAGDYAPWLARAPALSARDAAATRDASTAHPAEPGPPDKARLFANDVAPNGRQ